MSEITIHGIDEVKAALKQLTPKAAEAITRKALRKTAQSMARKIRAAAPVETGRLKKAIVVRNSKYNRLKKNGVVGVIVRVKPGKTRKDPSGAWYGKFVEVGYNRGSRAVTGRQAVALGVVTQDQLNQKRAYVSSKRKFGRSRAGIRYRAGGNRVAGQYFVRDTFNAAKTAAAQEMTAAISNAVKQAAADLKL